MRFRQLCDIKEAIGVRKGNTFNWDVFSNAVTAGSYAGIDETAAMPVSSFTLTVGTATITEYGNSITLTRKLRDMSEYDIKSVIRQTLVNDMASTIDIAVWSKFAASQLVAQASNSTDTVGIKVYSNGTGTLANNATAGLSTGHVLSIVDFMKERNIPTFDGSSYVCVSHPSTLGKIRDSILSANQYTESGQKNRMSGEIGSFGGVRFIEQTNIAKGTGTDGTTTTAWTNGTSDWCFFFGNDTVAEAIAVPEEMRGKIPTDFGRSKGIAWYYLGGFGIVHTLAINSRIVKWDSAA